jgi:protein gp37
MADKTAIEWADATWNPILGCDRVSPGCDGCYAITSARIRASNPNPKIADAYAGLTERTATRLDWTGRVNQLPERLHQPLDWRKPRRIFVNSQSDLFHANVSDDFVAKIFAVMFLAGHHTFQVLTKRHARMRSLLRSQDFQSWVWYHAGWIYQERKMRSQPPEPEWPLPNVWLGISAEDQHWFNIRWGALRDTPAAIRWVSLEPLLAPLHLFCDAEAPGPADLVEGCTIRTDYGTGIEHDVDVQPGIDWVVTGGESGPHARPMHPDWPRALRDECHAAGVPFLFKQWGAWGPLAPVDADGAFDFRGAHPVANDGTVYAPADLAYPDGLRYGEAIRAGHDRAHLTNMYRLGKHETGRDLDGRTWDQYPVSC